MSYSTVQELSRQLLERDRYAKTLRREVGHLRATKRSMAVSDTTSSKMDEARKSMDSSTKIKSRRSGASLKRGSAADGPGAALPQDFIEAFTRKCGKVEESILAHKELVKEKEILYAALARAEQDAKTAEQDYAGIAELTGADAEGKSRCAIGSKKRNAYAYAQREAVKVYRERDSMRIQLESQSRELLRLAEMLQETTDAETQRTEAATALSQRKEKLAALLQEQNMLNRDVARKDKIADKNMRGPTEEDYIRHSNFDRRVALQSLSKESNLIKENDLAIRHRAMQIAKLQTRLELVGDAIVGDSVADEEGERVDTEIVEELAKEIEELHNSYLMAQLRMEKIDCEIEKMEWRGGALQHARESTIKEMGRIDREHRSYLGELQKTLEKERVANGQIMTRLQDDIDTLRRQSARKKRNPRPMPRHQTDAIA